MVPVGQTLSSGKSGMPAAVFDGSLPCTFEVGCPVHCLVAVSEGVAQLEVIPIQYFRIHQSARKPSRNPIFLPSSWVRGA